ncbi:MAG TPA: helix-hairpin-helix domain-containing protein, partial [Methanobacterium sp.]
MNDEQMDLRNIKGIGDRLRDKIISKLGGEAEFFQAVENFEVDRITEIDGVSQRRAIEIINAVLGNPTQEFLKTERASQIYDDIVNRILQFASTQYGKNRILLLNPVKDEEKINENIGFVIKAKETVSQLPLDEIKKLLKKIDPTGNPKPKYNPSKAILVESKEDYHRLMDLGLNSYCSIITGDEIENLEDFELIVYLYSDGMIELGDAFNVTMVNRDSSDFEIVPDVVLLYYQENYDLLLNVLKIKKILGRNSVIREILEVLDSLESFEGDEEIFDDAVEAAKKKADLKLKNSIKTIDLKGDEVLNLLNEEMPHNIQIIFDEVIKEARDEV